MSISAYSITYTFTQDTPLVFGNTRSSVISASAMVGSITDVNVTLTGVKVNNFVQGISEHDVLLVGPHGQKIILIGFVCEAFTTPGPITFTLDQSAPNKLPSGHQTPCVPGTYKPSDYAHLAPPFTYILDVPPAPPWPYSANLGDLNGTAPNGTWTLFAAEHEGNEGGTIASWTLTIQTDGIPLPCEFEDQFNDGVLTFDELNPHVQETGGSLVLTPASKKAYAVSDDSIFPGIANGAITSEIMFSTSGDPKEKGLMVTHWRGKKNLMEIQFNIKKGKVIVKQKEGSVLAKESGIFDFEFDTNYTVEARYTGTFYEVRINGTLVVTLSPVGTLPVGILGFQARGLTQSMNNVCVRP